jgi:hypothetical protein
MEGYIPLSEEVLDRNGGVGAEVDHPLPFAVGAVEVKRLAAPAPGCCLGWRGSIKVRNSSIPSIASSGAMGLGRATACWTSQAWSSVR